MFVVAAVVVEKEVAKERPAVDPMKWAAFAAGRVDTLELVVVLTTVRGLEPVAEDAGMGAARLRDKTTAAVVALWTVVQHVVQMGLKAQIAVPIAAVAFRFFFPEQPFQWPVARVDCGPAYGMP